MEKKKNYPFASSNIRVFWIKAVYTSSRRAGWGNVSSMTQRLRVTLCLSVHSWAGWGQMEGGVLGISLAWGLRWEVWPRMHGGFEWEDVTSEIYTIAEKCMCVSVHVNDFHLVIIRWISLSEKWTAGNSSQTKIASFYIRCCYFVLQPTCILCQPFCQMGFLCRYCRAKGWLFWPPVEGFYNRPANENHIIYRLSKSH